MTQINLLVLAAPIFFCMMGFQRRSKIGIAAVIAIIFALATGLEAQARPAEAQELILRAEPLPPDAQQFMVYLPAINIFFHQQSAGPRPTFVLQYWHWVSGREYFGPSYAFSVDVERQLTPKAAFDRCNGAFDRANAANRHRLNGYDCAFVGESENSREATRSRVHTYAKCNYVVILAEQTRLMPMPAQAPVGPLLTALDRAVAALRLGECTNDVTPQAGPSNTPAKSIQAPPPPKPVPAPAACSADFVAHYLAGLANQPPARRPAPGSVVALSEGGKACIVKMPVAAVAPPPQSGPAKPQTPEPRVIVRGRDGKYRIMTLAEANAAGASAPQFVVPGLAGEFEKLATTPLLIGPVQSYIDGQLVLPPLPNAPPGYKTGFDRAFDWAEARAVAEYNWARENKAQAAIAVLSMAVAMALPEVPAVAELGSLSATLVTGLTAPILATSTTTFIKTLMSTGSTGKAGLSAGKDAVVLIANALPSAFGGELFKTVSTQLGAPALVTSLAETGGSTAGDLTVQYGPAILSQPISANYQSTVSIKPQVPK